MEFDYLTEFRLLAWFWHKIWSIFSVNKIISVNIDALNWITFYNNVNYYLLLHTVFITTKFICILNNTIVFIPVNSLFWYCFFNRTVSDWYLIIFDFLIIWCGWRSIINYKIFRYSSVTYHPSRTFMKIQASPFEMKHPLETFFYNSLKILT